MRMADLGDIRLHWREDGDPDGAPVLFVNSLGTDLRMWDPMIAHLPGGLRLIRSDMRGHGLSDCPAPPYGMGALVRDAERLLEHAGATGALVVGLSVGGLVAQGLAVKRPDLVSGLVLSNTGAKIGNADIWDGRLQLLRAGGVAALTPATMERWFSAAFRATPDCALWRHMFERTPVDGYEGTAMAIAGTDMYSPTSGLRLPLLALAGSEDAATPPDLVRELAGLVPGAKLHLFRGAGHLPCIEQPEAYAATLAQFMMEIGHVR